MKLVQAVKNDTASVTQNNMNIDKIKEKEKKKRKIQRKKITKGLRLWKDHQLLTKEAK